MATERDVESFTSRREILLEMKRLAKELGASTSPRKSYEISTRLDEVSKLLATAEKEASTSSER